MLSSLHKDHLNITRLLTLLKQSWRPFAMSSR